MTWPLIGLGNLIFTPLKCVGSFFLTPINTTDRYFQENDTFSPQIQCVIQN